MHHRPKPMRPIRTVSVSRILDTKMREVKPNPEVVNELLTQWKDQDFDNIPMFMSLSRQHGDIEGLARWAEKTHELYLNKAATLYRSIDAAIDSMEHTVASMVYTHTQLSDEELNDLEAWNIEGLTVDLGVDELGEPVEFDFAKTPHLYCVCNDSGFRALTNNIANQLPEAKFVFLESANTTSCALAVPPADSQADIDACIEWLKVEQDQRVRMMDLYDLVSYPLFIFVNPHDENWLYDVDGLADFADGCGSLNIHLVVNSDTSFMSLLKRTKDPTLLTLMGYTQDKYGVVLDESSRYGLYRFLTMKQFDIWLERLENVDENIPDDYWGLPIYKDLGTSFVESGWSYQEVLDLDEAFRDQNKSRLRYLRRM